MVKINLKVDVDRAVIEKFNDWVEEIRGQIHDDNIEEGTRKSYPKDKILGDILNDVIINGVDCIVSWNGSEVVVDY